MRKLAFLPVFLCILTNAAEARDLVFFTPVIVASNRLLLASSEPAENQIVNGLPSRILLHFSQRLDPAGSSITVFDPYNQIVAQHQAQVRDGDLATPFSFPTNGVLAKGAYKVDWKAACACDAPPISGFYFFSVQ
jgi:methionine-rich copper-binding protein CopC